MDDGGAVGLRAAEPVMLRGTSALVSVGSSELGFEAHGGAIELTSEAFEVETADGARIAVPAGLPLRVAGFAAHRTSEDHVDPEGFVRTRHGYQLTPGTRLFTDLTVLEQLGRLPYRDASRLRAARRPIILVASIAELDATRGERRPGLRGAVVFGVTIVLLVLGALSGVWR